MSPAAAQKGHGFAFILRALKLVVDFQDSKIQAEKNHLLQFFSQPQKKSMEHFTPCSF